MKRISNLFICLLMMIMLSGCQSITREESESLNLSIVIANRLNTPDFSDSESLNEAINSVVSSFGNIQITVADGAPYVSGTYKIERPSKRMSSSKAAKWANAQVNTIYSILRTSEAETPEADLLSALSLAGRWLKDREEGKKQLLIIDNGVSTTGVLDFTNNLLRVDADEIIQYLEQCEAFPALDGVDVIWVGLGDTTDSQQPLTSSNRKNLECIWEDICIKAGAKSVTFRGDVPSKDSEHNSFPEVTPVDIIADDSMDISSVSAVSSKSWWLGEDKCLFLPDSAEFVNIEEVKATLKSIIELVNQDNSISLGFCGTTAKAGTAEGCRQLSMERARAVESLMCQMGLNKERVGSVMGLGYENPYYLNDQNADGSLNEKIACNNRAVIIFTMNSPIAEKLKKFNKE